MIKNLKYITKEEWDNSETRYHIHCNCGTDLFASFYKPDDKFVFLEEFDDPMENIFGFTCPECMNLYRIRMKNLRVFRNNPYPFENEEDDLMYGVHLVLDDGKNTPNSKFGKLFMYDCIEKSDDARDIMFKNAIESIFTTEKEHWTDSDQDISIRFGKDDWEIAFPDGYKISLTSHIGKKVNKGA